jgi:hypothetical protein
VREWSELDQSDFIVVFREFGDGKGDYHESVESGKPAETPLTVLCDALVWSV